MLQLDAEPITGPGGCRGWGCGASRGQGTVPGHGGCGAGLLRWALCSPVASAGWLAGWHPVLGGQGIPWAQLPWASVCISGAFRRSGAIPHCPLRDNDISATAELPQLQDVPFAAGREEAATAAPLPSPCQRCALIQPDVSARRGIPECAQTW